MGMCKEPIRQEDYAPITQGLRDYIKARWPSPSEVVLSYCDNIDAIHKALEEENAKLRKELKGRPSAGAAEVMAFVDRLTNAAARREEVTILGVDYTALPLDADGVPIHVGDWIASEWDTKAKVAAVTSDEVYWWESDGCHWCHAYTVRHYHKPTVMDVLDELLMNWPDCEGPEDEIALKNRIAKRLQLVDGDADE